jgi:hypothetical protein
MHALAQINQGGKRSIVIPGHSQNIPSKLPFLKIAFVQSVDSLDHPKSPK